MDLIALATFGLVASALLSFRGYFSLQAASIRSNYYEVNSMQSPGVSVEDHLLKWIRLIIDIGRPKINEKGITRKTN